MASKADKVLPLVAAVAPAAAAGVALLVEELAKDSATEQARREAALERREAELRRKAAELGRKEAELARKAAELDGVRRQLAEQASRTAMPAPRRTFERYTTPAPPCPLPIWEVEDGHAKLVVPERITYAWCRFFVIAPQSVQQQVSRQRRSQYRRIGRLPPHMGHELDAKGVPFYALRFVVNATELLERQRRFALMMNGERPPRQLDPEQRQHREPAMSPALKRLKRNMRRRARRRK